jgi:uncharacterized ParB-like nuclease family protein
MKSWAQHTHGLRGTIIFASEVKAGDRILYLDKQIDLGNDCPNDILGVEPKGQTQVYHVGGRRLQNNTLVFRVDLD